MLDGGNAKNASTADIFKNEKNDPMPKRKGLEFGADNTLMGRLGARIASRDFIDELNLGFGPVAKKAENADFRPDGHPRQVEPNDLDILHIPTSMRMSNAIGMGMHQQTYDEKASNMSDPIKAGDYRDNSAIPGSNMADQAKAQGNVFGKKLEVFPEPMLNELKLQEGMKVEMEHTTNPMIAREIAKDHLAETPDYYEKLKRAGL